MARRSMREEIVDAAVAQFHSKGYNAAGVKDITDAASTPKGSFYNHFESKESLAVVALNRYGASRRLQDLAASDIAPLVRLRKHFEFLRDETVDAGFARGCLIGNFGAEVADHSETIRAGVRESLGHWASMISDVLVEAQQAARCERTSTRKRRRGSSSTHGRARSSPRAPAGRAMTSTTSSTRPSERCSHRRRQRHSRRPTGG